MALDTFPAGFLWGAATAAYQIEGAAREDGRGESIWDRFSHTPGKVTNGDTGDVADDHYHRYAEDVELMRRLGLKAYRFSIAWPRIQPSGSGAVNQPGIDFYSRLVDALLAAGIAPYPTLYHWDLPQALEDAGGWPNRDTAARFADYAEVVFRALGDRVSHWATLNEPWCTAYLGYGNGEHAPGRRDGAASLQAGHTLLLAHGLAVERFRSIVRHGKVGIVVNFSTAYAASDSPADQAAVRRFDAHMNRWFIDPVFKGEYPEPMCEIYGAQLPAISDDDRTVIAAPIDILGVNYYTRTVVQDDPDGSGLRIRSVRPQSSTYTHMGWEVYPKGLYDLLTWIRDNYGNPAVYVTENGAAFPDAPDAAGAECVYRDEDRRAYLRDHFRAAHAAINDGVRLGGYFVWSLLDNFEWAHGYTKRFGIVHVDYATQKRTPRESANWYAQVIRQNAVGDE